MKTNLDSYLMNRDLEKSGIWMNLGPETGFLVARFGGENSHKIKAAMAKHSKPFAAMIDKGLMDPEKEREINTTVFVECCVLDWRGVDIDGEKPAFSKELCVKLFMKLPEVADVLIKQSMDYANYKESLGNS